MVGLKNSGSGLGTFFSGIIRKWILKDLSTRLIGLRVGEDVPRKSSIIMTFELHNYVPLFIRRNLRPAIAGVKVSPEQGGPRSSRKGRDVMPLSLSTLISQSALGTGPHC